MGQIDMILKDYLSDRRRFADVFNGSVFAGQQILRAEELEPVPASAVQKSQDGYMERISDYVMRQKYTGNLFYIWILENQDKIDYSMIIRVMLKEAMEYDKQLRELKKKNAEHLTLVMRMIMTLTRQRCAQCLRALLFGTTHTVIVIW